MPLTTEQIAQVCHEATRALHYATAPPADPGPEPWEDLTETERSLVLSAVTHARAGRTPRELHSLWLRAKWRDGWHLGPFRDPAGKTHPMLVAWEALPASKRHADELFAAIVTTLSAPRHDLTPFGITRLHAGRPT